MTAAREILPNPGDAFQSLRYLQDQAALGRFKGHTTAYLVLLYLVMNMWTKVPNRENAGLGMVMYGRSSIEAIAEHTTVSRRTVQGALAWLQEARWIDTERSYMASGREDRRYLLVLLDASSHRERDRIRQAEVAIQEILGEGADAAPSGV